MRLRFRSIEYQFGGASSSLERYFRDLRDELLRQGQHYGIVHTTAQWRPPVDIHETADMVRIKIELAGMSEDTIEVTLYDNALVVAGRRDDDSEQEGEICYHEAQVRYGPFRAEILLPAPVQQDNVEATYENGFLRVQLPKASPSEPGSLRPRVANTSGSISGPRGNLNAAPTTTAGPQSVSNSVATAPGPKSDDQPPTKRVD